MFLFRRRPGIGYDKILPTWLIQPGPVLLRNFERTNKNDVLVKRVELIEANPNYAIIKDGRGITKTVSTKDLAPAPIMIDERANDQNTEMVNVNDDYINTPQNIQPDEYDNMIEEAKSRNPEISIKRLSIPKEIICPSESQDDSDVSRRERKGDDAVVTRSGRVIKTPTRYQSFETDRNDD